ncbi:MAG: mannosyltransferase family protein [Chloroflexota bacterium]
MRTGIPNGLSALGRRLAAPAIPAARERAAGQARATTMDWAIIRQATLLWLVTRVAFIVFTIFAVPFTHQSSHGTYSLRSFPPSSLLAQWNRWDTQWYGGIATNGYHELHTAAFFPLYPLFIRLLAGLIGFDHLTLAALIVANLGTLAAFIGLALVCRDEFGAAMVPFTIRALAAFPLAFFLAGGYSDSLFLAFTTFTLLFARRGAWLPAFVCAMLATWTRAFGIALILPLLWEYVQQHRGAGGDWRTSLAPRIILEALALAAAVPLALALWALYLWRRFGDPFAYLTAERQFWNHYSVSPWQWVSSAVTTMQHLPAWSFPQERALFDLIPVVTFLLLTLLTIRRLPTSFTLYLLGIMAIVFTSSIPLDFIPFNGEGRYMLAAMPLFLLLGRLISRRPALDLLIVSGGFLLQGLFTAFFLRGGWLV